MIIHLVCKKVGKSLFVSGTTGRDGSITRDILDDLIHLPTRNAENTEIQRCHKNVRAIA